MGMEEPKLRTSPNLETLPIRLLEFATPENRDVSQEENFETNFEGVPVSVNVKIKSFFEKKMNQMPLIDIIITVSTKTEKDVEAASVKLSVLKDKNGKAFASTKVGNYNRELKGLGRTLWEVALKLIQQITKKLEVPVKHQVSRVTCGGLTNQKWNELFAPLFEKYNYSKRFPDLWEKMYLPKEK